jgi:hypothetical protein
MKIAAFVDSMALSQNIFYMTKTFNKLGTDKISPFCFYSNLSTQAVGPDFAVMNCYYGNHYSGGPAVATSIETLKILHNLNIKARKFFYCWDLEWLRNPQNYSDNIGLFRNEYISIVARSESHARCIENYTNKKVSHIIEDWNYEEVKELIWSTSN